MILLTTLLLAVTCYRSLVSLDLSRDDEDTLEDSFKAAAEELAERQRKEDTFKAAAEELGREEDCSVGREGGEEEEQTMEEEELAQEIQEAEEKLLMVLKEDERKRSREEEKEILRAGQKEEEYERMAERIQMAQAQMERAKMGNGRSLKM